MDQGMLVLMKKWGASEADLALAGDLEKRRRGVDDGVFEVWPDNWAHWLFFLQVSTQWERAGMAGQRMGLNWPGIEVVARALGIRGKAWREQAEALLVVEKAVLVAEQEQTERST